MSVPTLNSMWINFMLQSGLDKAPLEQKQVLEYAFKCGIAACIVEQQTSLNKEHESVAALALQNIMHDFNNFIHNRMRIANATRTDN